MSIEREIKIGPKLEKRLIYLGFEEQNTNIDEVPVYQLDKRYFVHSNGSQVRVNVKEKTLTILSPQGNLLETQPMFLSSYIKSKYL